MDFSMVALRVMASYLVISGLVLVFRGKTFVMVLKDFLRHPALGYLAGVFLVILGLIVVIQHNVWDGTWRTVVTVFGMLILLKGIVYVFFPQAFLNLPYGKMRGWFKAVGVVVVAFGVYLWTL